MLKNTRDQMDALELAEQARKRNIIDMAVGFAGMMPLFQEGSAELIKEKLTETFVGLERIGSDEEFNNKISPVQYDDIMGQRLNH